MSHLRALVKELWCYLFHRRYLEEVHFTAYQTVIEERCDKCNKTWFRISE